MMDNSINIRFHPNGEAVSDYYVDEKVKFIISAAKDKNHFNLSSTTFTFSTFLILQGLRAELLENPELQAKFKFQAWEDGDNGCGYYKEIPFDRYMRGNYYPKIFDLNMVYVERILTCGISK